MKTIIISIFLFLCISIKAQDNGQEKLKLYSISISPLNVYFDDHTGGLSFSAEGVLKKENNLYKLLILGGIEPNFIGGRKDSFFEIDALFEKELFIVDWFYLDVSAGVGYFNYKEPDQESNGMIENQTIGFPFQSKLRFQTKSSFAFGVKLHTNMNRLNTIYSIGAFIQCKL
ncbi:hypothetical protein N9Q58_01330 [Polaribacter sp.]|nr:hypothetical protein [Polaribacter sp.]